MISSLAGKLLRGHFMRELFLCSSLVCGLGSDLSAFEIRYQITLLDLSNPDVYYPFAGDISDSGYIVGQALSAGGSQYRGLQVGWTYNPSSGVSVIARPDYNISARAVNNVGQVAVYAFGEDERAFRYTPGIGFQDLGNLGGTGPDSEHSARGINGYGQVTGDSERPDGSIHAFRYTDGQGMQDLGTLGGQHSHGYDINDAGWVTGRSRVADGSDHAFLFRDGIGMVDLGPGGGVSINGGGVVAGISPFFSGAVLFKDGQTVPMGTLPGTHGYLIGGLNEANEVVGSFLTSDNHELAFLATEAAGPVNLNTLIDPNSGWLLQAATGINNQDQIVGFGIYDGQWSSFRLDPIPEPSSWMLLLLGSGLLLWGRRWKR